MPWNNWLVIGWIVLGCVNVGLLAVVRRPDDPSPSFAAVMFWCVILAPLMSVVLVSAFVSSMLKSPVPRAGTIERIEKLEEAVKSDVVDMAKVKADAVAVLVRLGVPKDEAEGRVRTVVACDPGLRTAEDVVNRVYATDVVA